MHDTPTTPLPGSWLTSRLGVNPREIEELRENGELFAVRGQEEWLYPAWQFGPGGRPQRLQGCSRRRARRVAPRGLAAPAGRPGRRRPAGRPALRGSLGL